MRNSIKKTINKISKHGPVISLFHNWENIDHSLKEIETPLKNAHKKLKDNNNEIKIVSSILSKQKVGAKDLNLHPHIKLTDKNVALYFAGENVITQNISTSVKNDFILSNTPFILPLILESEHNPTYIILVSDDSIKTFSFDHHLKEEVQNDFPKNLKSFIDSSRRYEMDERSRIIKKQVQSSDEEEQHGKIISDESVANSRYQLLKKIVHTIESKSNELKNKKIILFGSGHYNKLFSKLSHSTKVIDHFHEFNLPAPYQPKDMQNFEKLVSTIIENEFTEDTQVKMLETTDNIEKSIVLAQNNLLNTLIISRPFLTYHLGKLEFEKELLDLNNFVLTCLNTNLEIKTTHKILSLFAIDKIVKDDDQESWIKKYIQTNEYSRSIIRSVKTLWDDYLNHEENQTLI